MIKITNDHLKTLLMFRVDLVTRVLIVKTYLQRTRLVGGENKNISIAKSWS